MYPTAARNTAIFYAKQSGKTVRELAEEHSISLGRVRQILNKQERQRRRLREAVERQYAFLRKL